MEQLINFTFFQLRSLLYSWKATLILIITPLLMITGIGMIILQIVEKDNFIERFKIAIVDNDQTMETRYVTEQLLNSEHLTKVTEVLRVDEKTARTLIKANEIAAIIILPQGFSKDIKKGINTPVKVIGNAQRPLQSELVKHLMESAAKFTSAAQSGINTIYHFLYEDQVTSKELSSLVKKSIISFSLHVIGRGAIYEIIEKNSLFQQDNLQYYILSFYLLLLMIWSFGIFVLLKKNTNHSLRMRLLSRGHTELIEKFSTLLTVVSTLIIFEILICIPLLFTFESEIIDFKFIVFTLFTVFMFVTFFLMIETLLKGEKAYLIIGLCFIIVGTIAGGHILPTVYFPTWLEKIGQLTINYWLLKLFITQSYIVVIKVLGLLPLLFLFTIYIKLQLDKRRC
ncbi:ABC transporter permease [Bacillus sp. 31A1R]|uniref:ABC transporter permease n=1 Tax=Robertmurraya mangrovi TaxID=3098077 RepID=A0ABU5IXV6_9BACI|nr:ABC transporter permease [Bacillus sp. 31A1R]MDZ5471937.1 ABC transporter permease [Bacillus sp. 31A1R]